MPPRVDEDQRRPVGRDQRGQPIVVLVPDLVRHHRFERRARQLDAEIHRAAGGPRRRSRSGAPIGRRRRCPREARDLLDRLLRGRQADALQRRAGHDLLQPLERQRQVRAAPRADDGVDLVDDHRAHRAAASARLRSAVSSRYSDSGVVTRMCGGVRSIAARSRCVRVAGAHRGGDRRRGAARLPRPGAGCPRAARPGSCGCRRSAP